MSTNFLSSFNESTALPPPLNSTSNKLTNCLQTAATSIFSFSIVISILLLPLCIVILLDGLLRWWRGHRSSSSSSSPSSLSHSDCIIYHMMAMELIGILGWILVAYEIQNNETRLLEHGITVAVFTLYGEMCFHSLICAERHLAVVYPIKYRNLRGARGVKMRNVTMLMVWLLCVVVTCLTAFYPILTILSISIPSIFFIFYCSVSVLCFLIGPGPGKPGRDSERLRHTQAFYTILTTLLSLLFRLCSSMASAFISMRHSYSCMIWNIELWATLPSGLLIPFLFILRTQSSCIIGRATNKENSNQQK